MLTVEREALPARREHPQHRGHPEQLLDQVGGPVEHMLAVVEHDQHPPAGYGDADRVRCHRGQSQRACQRRHDAAVIADFGQVYEDTQILLQGDLLRHRQRHPRLAHATHTDERHQPSGTNTVCDLSDQVVTTDQRRQHNGQKAQPPLGAKRKKRTCADLEYPLGLRETL